MIITSHSTNKVISGIRQHTRNGNIIWPWYQYCFAPLQILSGIICSWLSIHNNFVH